MRAARLHKAGEDLRVEDVELPKIGSADVLIRIRACGNCHTDLGIMDGISKPPSLPMILGHEMAGEVYETGASVQAFSKGDRVLYNWQGGCRSNECYYCMTGHEEVCLNRIQAGLKTDGGYAEYVRAPAKHLVRLPKEISFEDGAPLACGGVTSYNAVRHAGVSLGESAIVFGAGGLGLYTIQLAKLRGAKVIAVDIVAEKLETAKKYGADYIINAKESDVPEEVKKLTNGRGADVVIDYVAMKKSADDALKSLRRVGRYVLVGFSREQYPLDMGILLWNAFRIMGSVSFTQQDMIELVELVREGRVKSTVTKTFPLDHVNDALRALRNRQIQGRAVTIP
jgi:2-desacetyl-2-hydroxyethyl bacteriochlorophyllide A dehydrogenase